MVKIVARFHSLPEGFPGEHAASTQQQVEPGPVLQNILCFKRNQSFLILCQILWVIRVGKLRFLLCYFNFPGDRDLVLLLQLVQLGLRKKFFSTCSMSSSSSLGPSCHSPPFTIVENLICNFSLFSCKYTHIIFIGPRSDHSLPMSVTD